MSEVVSRVSITKGWRRVGMVGQARDGLQNGGRPQLKSRQGITGLSWLLSG